MARLEHHDRLTSVEKADVYKVAYGNVRLFLSENNNVAANVLAFALLEERVLAAFVGATMSRYKTAKPNHQEMGRKKFNEVVKGLKVLGVIDPELGQKLLNAADERNRRIHEMIWRLQSFTKSSAENYVRLSKQVSNEHKKFLTKQKHHDAPGIESDQVRAKEKLPLPPSESTPAPASSSG